MWCVTSVTIMKEEKSQTVQLRQEKGKQALIFRLVLNQLSTIPLVSNSTEFKFKNISYMCTYMDILGKSRKSKIFPRLYSGSGSEPVHISLFNSIQKLVLNQGEVVIFLDREASWLGNFNTAPLVHCKPH